MIIGLTGGIAVGKNESANFFKTYHDIYSIDVDAISKEITTRRTLILDKLIQVFGHNILLNGSLNRKKMGYIIFSDKLARKEIEKITHNHIIMYAKKIISYKMKYKYNIIINAPLLFESGLNKICDKIIIIKATYNIQVKRIMLRDNLNITEINKRIYSQMPIDEKIRYADYVVDNTGSKKDLKKEIDNLHRLLTS
ncbi:MAG: dephospho-CoA kinase [Endomicrobium sp.]|jgi:dephospho-CoA kinase|nr:dephospho-CoA kinase [Endomicrobium sp.]